MSQDSLVVWDLFVVGAGSGGVRAARLAAERKVKTALAEERDFGGTCVNRGCIPKKLYRYASGCGEGALAESYGWSAGEGESSRFSLSPLRAAKDREVARLRALYEQGSAGRGTKIFREKAQLLEKREGLFVLQVGGQRVVARRVLLASGAEPIPLSIEGGALAATSDDVFALESLPPRVIVVGGGYIAMECAAIFNGLGSKTLLLHRNEHVLRGFDRDCVAQALLGMRGRGVNIALGRNLQRIETSEKGLKLSLEENSPLLCDFVLAAVGRRALTNGLGLEQVGLKLDARGKIPTNENFETEIDNLYALGDTTDSPELTPVAIRQAEVFVQRLYDNNSNARCETRVLPKAVFSDPPIARVGLSEQEVSFPVRVYEARFVPLRRRFLASERVETEESHRVFLKLIERAEEGSAVGEGEVVGCHMAGEDAPEIIQSLAPALVARAKKKHFDAVIPLHPTSAEEFMTLRTFRLSRGGVSAAA